MSASPTKKRKTIDGKPSDFSKSVGYAAENLFRAIYSNHAEQFSDLTEMLLAHGLIRLEVLQEVLGVAPSSISKEHLSTKLRDPNYVLPTQPPLDTKEVVKRGGHAAKTLAFMIYHCRDAWTRPDVPIPGATLVELLDCIRCCRKPALKVIFCVVAQAVVDEGKITLEDLGVTVDDVWETFPYKLESRDEPLAALDSEELMTVYMEFHVIDFQLNDDGHCNVDEFYCEWIPFIRKFRTQVWRQMKEHKKRLENVPLGNLTQFDLDMVQLLRQK